ncbi:MAG: aminotransferase class V-fold PLP-dependent enzyme [Planctomycetota bacterium]
MSDRPPRIYLDHAATSWPKSSGVAEAMTAYLTNVGATASRGGYASARQANQLVSEMRSKVAALIGVGEIQATIPGCITFHGGCTLAIHAALDGIELAGAVETGSGDNRFHVVTSAAEHNAVIRTLHSRCRREHGDLTVVPTNEHGQVDAEAMAAAIRPATRLVACTHASNVTGAIQPIEQIGRRISDLNQYREPNKSIAFFCDAAQTIGYLPIDVLQSNIDLLVAPAHKGLGGPPGIAFLFSAPGCHDRLMPVVRGGTGGDGRSWSMPQSMPMKLEPGTMNLPALAGFRAALNELNESPPLASEAAWLHQQLENVDGLRVIGVPGPLPLASIDFGPHLMPQDAAAILDLEFGIEVRSGFHCAGAIHDCLGTANAGTVRISGGHRSNRSDYQAVCDAVSEINASIRILP